MKISAVCWDVDKVWYAGYSTNFLAEKINSDPGSLLQDFLSQGWFGPSDVDSWAILRRRGAKEPIESAKDLADLLTDFHYEMTKEGSSEPVITMKQLREGKLAIIRGLTMEQIREVADSIEYSPGLLEAIETFRQRGLYQAAFSDAPAPFIIYHVKKLGLDYGEAAPTMVQVGNEKMLFEDWMLQRDDISLAGTAGEFNKAGPVLAHFREQGHSLSEVAIIDDSGVNIERLLLPISQAGGIALGYNPTEVHRPIFRKYSIPILKGLDLRAFAEIVADRKKITEYCE
jgi:FMN phosphatase YigB (HAD superfamily)